jgi:hypothetical protein
MHPIHQYLDGNVTPEELSGVIDNHIPLLDLDRDSQAHGQRVIRKALNHKNSNSEHVHKIINSPDLMGNEELSNIAINHPSLSSKYISNYYDIGDLGDKLSIVKSSHFDPDLLSSKIFTDDPKVPTKDHNLLMQSALSDNPNINDSHISYVMNSPSFVATKAKAVAHSKSEPVHLDKALASNNQSLIDAVASSPSAKESHLTAVMQKGSVHSKSKAMNHRNLNSNLIAAGIQDTDPNVRKSILQSPNATVAVLQKAAMSETHPEVALAIASHHYVPNSVLQILKQRFPNDKPIQDKCKNISLAKSEEPNDEKANGKYIPDYQRKKKGIDYINQTKAPYKEIAIREGADLRDYSDAIKRDGFYDKAKAKDIFDGFEQSGTNFGISHQKNDNIDKEFHAFRVEISKGQENELRYEGLYPLYNKVMKLLEKHSGHPVTSKTIGWVSHDDNGTYPQSFTDDEVEDILEAHAPESIGREYRKHKQKIMDIITDGHHPAVIAKNVFHHHMDQQKNIGDADENKQQ